MTVIHEPPELTTIFLECPKCKGEGEIVDPYPSRPNRLGETQLMNCLKCGGQGTIEKEVCSRCEQIEALCECWNRDELLIEEASELFLS